MSEEVNRNFRCKVCDQMIYDDENPPTSAIQGYCNFHEDVTKDCKKKCDYCNGIGLVTRGEHVFPCPKKENHK